MPIHVYQGTEAQARKTPLEGGLLGWSAVLMRGLCWVAMCVLPAASKPAIRRFVRVWMAGLFCFFGGVHRGASFYIPKGPQLTDLLIFLLLHVLGLSALLMPADISWKIVQGGTLLNLATDIHLARQDRLPRFMLRLRPFQLGAAFIMLRLLAPNSGERGVE